MTIIYKLKNYFETMYNDNTNPCIINEVDTKKTVFVNLAMEKLLKETDSFINEDTDNQKCYELLYNKIECCDGCHIDNLKVGDFTESYVYNKKFDRHYRSTNTLIEINGVTYNYCKYFLTSSYTNRQSSFEDALSQTIEIFAKNENNEMSTEFLALLGEFYQSDKAFVFYISDDRKSFYNKYRWTKSDEIKVQVEATEKISIDKMLKWMSTKDKNNIVEAHISKDKTINSPLEMEILEKFNLKNLTFCVIENNNNEIIAGVGLSNRAGIEFDYRLLKSTTHFIKDGFNKSDMQDNFNNIIEIDFLSGFYNRNKYIDTLKTFKLNPPKQLGVIFININGLKNTNEYYGFEQGDELITKSSTLIKQELNEDFYRISGDEFIALSTDDEDVFLSKINKLHSTLKKHEKPLFSLGYAWKKENNINIAKLINEADVVMYINKQEYYHLNDYIVNDVKDNILHDLLKYIANDEFLVYLQPQINLIDNSLAGAEALIRRFDKSNNKMVFPDQFIPLYEQKSVIRHVDLFVLDKVCELLVTLIAQNKAIPISVNLSRVTLMEHDIVDTITKICDKHNIPHDLIVIEVTERIGVIENDVATTLIDNFKNNGFRISLDDFGCAYSNIVTLANISVDEVKIDKSLIDNVLTCKKNKIIVLNMLNMCNSLDNTHTLAEGIETQEQADILREFNCTYGQGYLYSRPIPINEFCEKYI